MILCRVFLSAFLLATLPVAAQTGNWIQYITTVNGRPTSVMADLDLREEDHSRHPYLIITGPLRHDCPVNGIPGAATLTTMEDILQTTSTILIGVTSFSHAGTVTANCSRLNCYYAKDTIGIRAALRRMYDRNFKSSEYILQCSYDPEWNYYNHFLYPDDTTLEWSRVSDFFSSQPGNKALIGKKNELEIATCFNTDSATRSFCTWATGQGYTIVKNVRLNKTTDYWCVVIKRGLVVSIDSIARYTLASKKIVDSLQGSWAFWQLKNN